MNSYKPSKGHPWKKSALGANGMKFSQWDIKRMQQELKALKAKGVANGRVMWLQATIQTWMSCLDRATTGSDLRSKI